MEDKKSLEKGCLAKTRKYTYRANKGSKEILELLCGEVIEGESPDFIIRNGETTIGVEHFMVDTLLGNKKAARTRLRQSEIKRTFDKYHNNIDENEEEALKEVESIVQADVDAVQNFDYRKFIKEFERISIEHSDRVNEYKRLNNEISKILFLIEIPISNNKMIALNQAYHSVEIKGRRFPITTDMLRVLKKVSEMVDYIVISVMHENYKESPYVVYAIDCNRFEESIAPQINEVYYSFTYDWETNPFKTKLKLNLEKENK